MRYILCSLLLLFICEVSAQPVISHEQQEADYCERTSFTGQFWWFEQEDAIKQLTGSYVYGTISDTLQAREIGEKIIADAAGLLNLGESYLRVDRVYYIPQFDQYNIIFFQYLNNIRVQPHGQIILFIKEQKTLTANNSCISGLRGNPEADLSAQEALSVFKQSHPGLWETSAQAESAARADGTWKQRENPSMQLRISPLNVQGSGVKRLIGDVRLCYILDIYGIDTIYFLDADTGEVVQEINRL